MGNIETFGNSVDLIYAKQKEDVAKMRAALLSCSSENLSTPIAKRVLTNITAMRIYHQISRIIRYTELMDKLEAKLYESLESTIDKLDSESMLSWKILIDVQEKLQKNMIESHKLLQPYMELQDIQVIDLIPDATTTEENVASMLISQDSREKIRSAASSVLAMLDSVNDEESLDTTLQSNHELSDKSIDIDSIVKDSKNTEDNL